MPDEEKKGTGDQPDETEDPKPGETYSKAEVEALMKAQYNKLNARLSAQGAENARLRRSQVQDVDPTIEIQLSERKQKVATTGEADPYIQILERELSKQKQRVQIENQQAKTADKRAEMMQELEDAGVDIGDDAMLADLDNALDDEVYMGDGTFKRAERQKAKLLKTAPKKKPTTEGGPEVPEDKLKEQHRREFMEEFKLTDRDATTPSGSGRTYTRDQIDKMSIAEYTKEAAEIEQAARQGRIK